MKAVSEKLIRLKAYELWEQSGRPPGLELEHWLLAERTLLNGAPKKPPAAEAPTPAKRKVARARKPDARTRRGETTM